MIQKNYQGKAENGHNHIREKGEHLLQIKEYKFS